jgi:hypothetical protein
MHALATLCDLVLVPASMTLTTTSLVLSVFDII